MLVTLLGIAMEPDRWTRKRFCPIVERIPESCSCEGPHLVKRHSH